MSPITVYSRTKCPRCKVTKTALSKQGAVFVEVNLDNDKEAEARINELAERGEVARALPIVEFEDQYVSGFRPDKIKEIAVSQKSALTSV